MARDLARAETGIVRREATAIKVQNLSKSYRLYARPGDILRELATRRDAHAKIEALKDISFTVGRGEVVGVLGRNGAGKSTLLKVMAGVLEHDFGTVALNGRVAAILELGTGLNPNDSGRENIIFGGICRGETRASMLERFDEIVAFAGLRDVIDRPFKTYSSGMQARLLFSTAIHVTSDVLIIDEALAAGDALFQEKCNERMREIARSGRTIFFVSHSPAAVQQLCTRGMVLHRGRMVFDGPTKDASHCYDEILARAREQVDEKEWADGSAGPVYLSMPDEPTRKRMRAFIAGCQLTSEEGRPTSVLEVGRNYRISMKLTLNQTVEHLLVTANIRLPSGLIVHSFHNDLQGLLIRGREGETLVVHYDFACRLGGGEYTVAVGVGERLNGQLAQIQAANSMAAFSVLQTEKFGGLFDFDGEMTVESSATSP